MDFPTYVRTYLLFVNTVTQVQNLHNYIKLNVNISECSIVIKLLYARYLSLVRGNYVMIAGQSRGSVFVPRCKLPFWLFLPYDSVV